MNKIKSSIALHQLELFLHLGWPDAERLVKQKVMLDIHIHFLDTSEACLTDILDEKTDYDALNKKILEVIVPRHFRLLEHLGYEIYQLVKSFLPENTLATLCVTKYPAIANLKGGASFWYGDEIYDNFRSRL